MSAAGTVLPQPNIARMLDMFAAGPSLLEELLSGIPSGLLKKQRCPGKWTIHEHAVHLTVVDPIMQKRLELFQHEAAPVIVPYQPGKNEDTLPLLEMELTERLAGFATSRVQLVNAFKQLQPADWSKQAQHPEYELYTPLVMLRHLLMHDHLHMYRIEELWLTREEFLQK